MNILKHMEAIFVVALAAAGTASFAAHAMPQTEAQPQLQLASNIAAPGKMAVVVVRAKRLSAAEKQRLIQAERSCAAGRA